MHLAFLTPEYPHPFSTPSGGLGTSIRNLAEKLSKKGERITIFVYGQMHYKIFEERGINFHYIKQRNYPFLGWWFHRKFLEKYINRVIKEQKIDVLEGPDWTGITAFMDIKCPVIIRLHGSDSYFCRLENRPQKKKNFWFEKFALAGADELLSVSQFTAQKTAEIFNIKREIKVIPNSIDVNIFKPTGENVIPGRILYFGSIIRKKGVLELVEIFSYISKKNPEARLLMAGRDVIDVETQKSTRELFLEKLPKELVVNVQWLGTLAPMQVREEISRATVIVLPSFAEALPMAWLEAMAMEKAMVTSNVGWAEEIMIDGKTGFTVHPTNHELYAKKVLKLLNDPELASGMGKAARNQVILQFSSEVVVEKNLRFYRSIIGK
ncbi:glycosyltransferase family 4 protein [Antarcticibacterium flavum]|uniref:Glycosyltransferase family 4 protein n=2 Tax=Flavobacteriaceae TaxID=49546 RepID=A0A5B7X7Z2_9FLAO|nr:glycosyltransferase family 1 protein [Antarcticibacterium sp. W02-3]QCY71459.1 glycosyltransferase family 4 protein [Antarcticibacterium flavum]